MRSTRIWLATAIGFIGIFPAAFAGCEANKMKASEVFKDRATIEMADAAQAGDAARVQAAAHEGGDPNAQGKDQITPLLYVMGSSVNKRGLAALLASGANPNLPSTGGVTPMSFAARAKDPELLRMFLKSGGNANLRDEEGLTLIGLAARDQRWDNVDSLLAAGADINALDNSGYTTVMRVALHQQYDRVAWMLEKGADPKPVSKIGDSLPRIVLDDPMPQTHPQYRWKQHVIEMLRARGYNMPQPQQHN
jgi:uncharacterized protein